MDIGNPRSCLEEAMADQKPSSNTAMNKSKEGVAGEGPTAAATAPPTVSHSNEVQEQKRDEKQDSRTRPETDQPLVGGVYGQQNPQLKR
jgi:hypothetical protein